MQYSILKNQDPYKPVKKLVITQSQLKRYETYFQVYLWMCDYTPIRQFLEESIKKYLKTLDQKNELTFEGLKITADRCSCGWVLTLYIKVSPFYCSEVSEEEFASITS